MNIGKLKRITEATIQAELYHQFRKLGIRCILEYPIKLKNGEKCRVDIIVLDNEGNILYNIECKSRYKPCQVNKKTRQYSKYLQIEQDHGIPFTHCTHKKDIIPTVKKIYNFINVPS